MVRQSTGNEGFRLLDELVCQAVPGSSAAAFAGVGVAAGQGGNAGIHVWEELVLGSSAQAGAPEPAKGTSPARLPHIDIVLDRDFSSYTADQQAGLLSALRELLIVTSEVRVVRRLSEK